ncbi:H-2 class II histocompatibility antigen, E-D alpha chain-like, partial [Protobothrops mucrosquamatus]|uniref:H-2 class II histocompatibility antigen, E-D alpha chain-like n=1 Tax=Protobothrops mucrosquamatus TaxID=103944 RepID=UPI000775915A
MRRSGRVPELPRRRIQASYLLDQGQFLGSASEGPNASGWPVHKAEVLQTSPEDLPIIEGNRPRVGGSQSKPPPQLKPLSSLSTPAEPPKVMVYPEQEVELGEPNVLICMADNFSPPVLNMTWLKNGHLVTEGVQTMDYYPKKNHAFRRFSYLTFVPNQDDNYICEVDHWGLKEPLGKLW